MLTTNTPYGPVVVRTVYSTHGTTLRIIDAERWLPVVTVNYKPTVSRDLITSDTSRYRESLTGELIHLPITILADPLLQTRSSHTETSTYSSDQLIVDGLDNRCTPLHRFGDSGIHLYRTSRTKRDGRYTEEWLLYGPLYNTSGLIKRTWFWRFRRITNSDGSIRDWQQDPLVYLKFISDIQSWYQAMIPVPPLTPSKLTSDYGWGPGILSEVQRVARLVEPDNYVYLPAKNVGFISTATYSDVHAHVRVLCDNITMLFREHALPRQGGLVYDLFHADDPKYHPEVIHALGQLANGMANSIRKADVNTTMLIKEIIELIRDPRAAVKVDRTGLLRLDIANNFLKWKYGVRLTWSDLKKIWSAMIMSLIDSDQPASPFMFGHSRQSYSSTTQILGREYNRQTRYTGKVYYLPYDSDFVKGIARRLLDWELIPDLENVWDWVPYSFVVDWLVDFSGFFSAIDNRSYFAKLPVQSAEYGIYFSVAGPLPDGDWAAGFTSAGILYEYYNRWIQKELILPPLELAGGSGGTNNIPEALALIVQRATRL